jgi:hypothetical protein
MLTLAHGLDFGYNGQMKILIQANLLSRESRYPDFVRALDIMGMDYTPVHVFADTDLIFPDTVHVLDKDTAPGLVFDPGIPTLTFGSHKLARLAGRQGLSPAAFNNDHFDFPVWSEGFGLENLLNGDTRTGRAGDILASGGGGSFFIRPLKDDKTFSGRVVSSEAFLAWQAALPVEPDRPGGLCQDSIITVASVKVIHGEYRFFVVDGEVVTGSSYKKGSRIVYDHQVDPVLTGFGQSMVDRWQPAPAFVIDVADTRDGPKVVEINSFGLAGFYDCEMGKVVGALDRLQPHLAPMADGAKHRPLSP